MTLLMIFLVSSRVAIQRNQKALVLIRRAHTPHGAVRSLFPSSDTFPPIQWASLGGCCTVIRAHALPRLMSPMRKSQYGGKGYLVEMPSRNMSRASRIANQKGEGPYCELLIGMFEKGLPPRSLLDLGCHTGDFTVQFANRTGATRVVGVDTDETALSEASKKGIETYKHDLNLSLPFANNSFDVVASTQVIEHLTDCDLHAAEILRVLAPDGYAVIATENLANWANIGSLVLGFQPFTENVSKVRRIGNPFSPNYGMEVGLMHSHIHVFTVRCLVEFLKLHGFEIEALECSGYPPLTGPLANFLSRIDIWHSRYVVAKVRKKK